VAVELAGIVPAGDRSTFVAVGEARRMGLGRRIAVGTEERHRLGSSLGSTCLLSFARAM